MAQNITTIQNLLETKFPDWKVLYHQVEDDEPSARNYCVVIVKRTVARLLASFTIADTCDLAYNFNIFELGQYEASNLFNYLNEILGE